MLRPMFVGEGVDGAGVGDVGCDCCEVYVGIGGVGGGGLMC